ncbi:MAG: ATP-binding cassette domain-containing protein [Chloroflexi bacterium]|nr:ATP-binding cassette domain-containing protein [Chloroflexota bacterium]
MVLEQERAATQLPNRADERPHEILEVRGLKVHFPIVRGLFRRTVGYVRAVDGITFDLESGETLALVGESGSGKTTVGRAILGAIRPTDGTIFITTRARDRIDAGRANGESLKTLRREVQFIFQDPYGSLNPRMTVFDIVADPLRVNGLARGNGLRDRVEEMLRLVGLSPELMRRYPHAFSGGQRQRIAIARALVMGPTLVVADEPASALDVSVQAQILNLLQDLRAKLAVSYLFISHDLSVVQYISQRIAVMYVGQIVEMAPTKSVFSAPRHPYTQALISSVPTPDPALRSRGQPMPGEVADPANPPVGCHLNPRCRYAQDLCRKEPPALRELAPGHFVRCHFAEELDLTGVPT